MLNQVGRCSVMSPMQKSLESRADGPIGTSPPNHSTPSKACAQPWVVICKPGGPSSPSSWILRLLSEPGADVGTEGSSWSRRNVEVALTLGTAWSDAMFQCTRTTSFKASFFLHRSQSGIKQKHIECYLPSRPFSRKKNIKLRVCCSNPHLYIKNSPPFQNF